MGYTEQQWPHHCVRLQRIRAAGLDDEYLAEYRREYSERIPDPHAVGDMAEAVISDEVAVGASEEVCRLFGLDLYEEEHD